MNLKKTVAKTKLSNEEKVQDLLDYYKEEYLELKQRISELRKAQKNPIIPDLASRSIPSKIKYAESSLAKEDFDKIEELLLEVDKEIEYCEKEETVDIPREIEESFKKINETDKKEVSDETVQEEEKG